MRVRWIDNIKLKSVQPDGSFSIFTSSPGKIFEIQRAVECIDDPTFTDLYFANGLILYGVNNLLFEWIEPGIVEKPIKEESNLEVDDTQIFNTQEIINEKNANQ